MKFREGDKVEFIYLGELKQGVVTEIRASNFDISYQVKMEFMGTLWVTERDLVAPAPVLKVPQFADDWINHCEQREYDLTCLLDYGNAGIPDEMYEWLISSADNQEILARAWMDGYEVEKEPLYYVKLPYFGYVTNRMDYTLSQSKTDAVMLTESKIKRMDERYWQFAVLVEDLEGEA
ncbi:DUF1642 domain-containing protein [Listeria monocytogenes]|nr:DUF1642 domain-containing protein [Listeria monocytogenes]EHT3071299.1 DUF1642 domain-containing protein [Listeria monocytogenes]EHU4367741.1 DUF1642 domain-containing protein [Listeria monocytogenes]EHU4375121.1 DUF1642 domain-containing protein [Listeria monocytogenes]EIB8251887.1 DUF1642 domain-containing protein [Listeria monocytogenes]